MSSDIDRQIEETLAEVKTFAAQLHDADAAARAGIEAKVTEVDAKLEGLLEEKRTKSVVDRIETLEQKALDGLRPSSKAAEVLRGAMDGDPTQIKSLGRYNTKDNWLNALVQRRQGDQEAAEFVKAVLGTSDATGQAIVPNNIVADIVGQIAVGNIYRGIMQTVSGVRAAAVDIPYELTAITAALPQGAYGSNKDIRDFSFAQATATLYTLAQIADVGNQLLRQSNGTAEQIVRRRLADSLALAEASWINNGTGSSQPQGFLDAFMDHGDVAAYKTTLSSEPRAATLGRAFGVLENRGRSTNGLGVVMSPTDFWEMATEGLGTSYAGGWAMDPTGGPGGGPMQRVWGVPVYRDPAWPTSYVGTAVAGYWGDHLLFFGDEFRIDVSSEAGSRFDQNITGFRAEEEIGYNAEPYVRTGAMQKILGI